MSILVIFVTKRKVSSFAYNFNVNFSSPFNEYYNRLTVHVRIMAKGLTVCF